MINALLLIAGCWNRRPSEYLEAQQTVQDGWVIKGARKEARTQIVWAVTSPERASLVYAKRVIEDAWLPTHCVLELDFKLHSIKKDISTFNYPAKHEEEEHSMKEQEVERVRRK